MPQPKRLIPSVVLVSVWLSGVAEGGAEGGRAAFYEGFEGPTVSWQQAGADTPHRIEFHSRIQGEAHVGQGCERIRLAAGHGSYVYLAHPIGRAPVIDELLISVWVKSDRAGIQLLAQVVLPRTRHPRTGAPFTVLIPGTTYTQVGRWEQLRLQNVVQQVARQARVLRSQYGPQVDEREAYVSQVLLNGYGGPGVTNLWIDDLDVAGLIEPSPGVSPPIAGPLVSGSSGTLGASSPLQSSWNFPGPGESNPPGRLSAPLGEGKEEQAGPRLVGSVLMVQGREFFPRIIQYRGESLAFLQSLGFNVVWLPTSPGPELIGQAERLGLWLICPPPIGHDIGKEAEPPIQGIREKIPSDFDRVLAWDLTLEPASIHWETIARWAQRVRRADHPSCRPLICRANGGLQALSRVVDIVWLTRPPLDGGSSFADYLQWLRQRELLVRPGTPLWVSIPTQLPLGIRSQAMLLGSGRELPENFSEEQIRLTLYAALAGGSRGVVYESDRPLDGQDTETVTRAAAVELLNRELDILEPWLAAGSESGPLQTGHQDILASLRRTERSRLALVFSADLAPQEVGSQASAQPRSFILPGLPEAHEAYQILGGTLRPLRRDRIPGGYRIRLEEFDLTAAVVISQDPLVISTTTRRAQNVERRLAELHHQLAFRKFQDFQTVLSRLPPALPEGQRPGGPSLGNPGLAQARDQLALSQQRLENREYLSAILASQQAQRTLRFGEQRIWESFGIGRQRAVQWPLAVCFRMLPEHLEMVRRVRCSTAGPNLLVGGNFEDFQAMLAAGWRSGQAGGEIADASVELAQQAARSGQWGLRLAAVARQSQSLPEVIETPPAWVISPPIQVQAGQCLRIQGWVQVPQPIQGNVDGLVIVDSLGGENLSLRIQKTSGWQPFEMYRLVAQPGLVQVSFVLTGLGEAQMDDIMIQVLSPVGMGGVPGPVTASHIPW